MDCNPDCKTPGFYYYCKACDKACSECNAAGTTGCISCAGLLSFNTQHSCSNCPSGMYNSDSICLNCSSSCSTCSSFDFCLKCSDSRKTANKSTGICEIICNNGTYLLAS